MGNQAPEVVLYSYAESPFGAKIGALLTIKKIPHKYVKVARMPPRPELLNLGLPYRRIPVLAIGADLYCDTGLISTALEATFTDSGGYPSIYPPRKGAVKGKDTGMQRALAQFWLDRPFFSLCSTFLPWSQFPAAFLADRGSYRGGQIDPQKMEAIKPAALAQFSSHLRLLEDQLSDGREYILDTEYPGLVDASVYFALSWTHGNRGATGALNKERVPRVMAWMGRVKSYLDAAAPLAKKSPISGDDAAKLILSSSPSPLSGTLDQLFAAATGISLGDRVAVTPEDTGRIPTEGRLVHADDEQVVIEVRPLKGDAAVRVHFPRLGFTVVKAGPEKSKL